MPTSSISYSALIQPDRRLRGLVISSGILLAAIGVIVIMLLPLAVYSLGLLAAIWLTFLSVELRATCRAYAECRNYRLNSDGGIEIRRTDGRPIAAVYLAGSVILPRLAWLRVRATDGACWGELIVGNPRKNKEWRRFQVICRLNGPC